LIATKKGEMNMPTITTADEALAAVKKDGDNLAHIPKNS